VSATQRTVALAHFCSGDPISTLLQCCLLPRTLLGSQHNIVDIILAAAVLYSTVRCTAPSDLTFALVVFIFVSCLPKKCDRIKSDPTILSIHSLHRTTQTRQSKTAQVLARLLALLPTLASCCRFSAEPASAAASPRAHLQLTGVGVADKRLGQDHEDASLRLDADRVSSDCPLFLSPRVPGGCGGRPELLPPTIVFSL
jgi:hypothetical protein